VRRWATRVRTRDRVADWGALMANSGKSASGPQGVPSSEVLAATFARLCQQGDSGPGRIVDCQAALDRLEGDWDLFRDMLRYYLTDVPEMAMSVRQALERRDAKRLEHAAHQLVGMISNFDAHTTMRIARHLQQLGHDSMRAGALDDGAVADGLRQCGLMEQELARVMAVLRQFQISPGS
jgi:HPt (histidine-containing phosphotransfer) domain-containing protein